MAWTARTRSCRCPYGCTHLCPWRPCMAGEADGRANGLVAGQDYVREMEATLEAKDKALQDSRDQLKDLQEEVSRASQFR